MARDSTFNIEKFNWQGFCVWRQKIEDYLYLKDDLYLALEGKLEGMKDEYWKLLERKALGLI